MNSYQTVNLAYEFLDLLEWMTEEEAITEIKAVLETEYQREIRSEIDEDILYYYRDVLSDILGDIKALAYKYKQSVQYV